MCVVGAFEFFLHKGSIWTGPRDVLSFILHQSIFLHFLHHGTIFYYKNITSDDKNKYIDDGGSRIFLKQKVRKLYNAKYQKTYYNRYYVLKSDYIKDTRIRRTDSGKNKGQHVLCILKVHHIVMLKDHHSSYHVFML